jgi:hypothetical protein
VNPGPEPSDILWENLGVSACERVVRIKYTFVISLIFVIATSYIAVVLEEIDPSSSFFFNKTGSLKEVIYNHKYIKPIISVLLVVAIPACVNMINWLSEKVLEHMAKFEKRRSISQMKYAMTAKVSRLTIFNTAFILFLISFNGGVSKDSWLPILKGNFNTSSV